ncbi:cytidylate kinase-like family protein [Candidatus Woesebacteria bacterium]|nr:cytidylate kinase-like family protein [Candidatus Woesebacteria bacterium]
MNLDLSPILNRAANWSWLKDQMEFAYAQAESIFAKPFITIAREPGSGGAPIAKALAEKLKYEYVDEQLVEEVARSTRRRKEVIRSLDEKSRSAVEDLVHSVMNPEYVNESRYTQELFHTILAYAYKGEVVILGRGANFVTPFARGLHALIVAPYEVRVQRAMDFEGHSRDKAKQVIKEVEDQRRDFVKQYISKDVRKPYVYDLTINTQFFTIEQSRDLVISALKKKFAHSLKVR